MGYALAHEARKRGANVFLVSGPTHLPVPHGITWRRVVSAEQMREAVLARYDQMDIVIMAAAVADYTPSVFTEGKIKKSGKTMQVTLESTADILAEMGRKKKKQILIGFAAEEGFNKKEAIHKLKTKKTRAIILNRNTR